MSEVQDAETLRYPLAGPAALEPPEEWARLWEGCPVARVTLPSGDEATLLTRYADVRLALSDPRLSREGLQRPDAARVAADDSGGVFTGEMARALNDEGHERWRRMVGKWFTAKRMVALRPGIEETAERLIDAMVAPGGPADLVAHLAFPLPVLVICDMLGVPDGDRDDFKHWSDAFLNLTRYTRDELATAQREFTAYMAALLAAKRTRPGDDLLSRLLTSTDADGAPMSERALVATGQALLLAGHETTAGFIAKTVAHLLADRRRWERLLADPALVRTAVEEALRFDPNNGFGMLRYVHEDVEIPSGTLTRGTTVVCSMQAANRDETAFADAGGMDLGRTPNPHLTFGSGAHSCLGQPLARTELQAVLHVLLRRLPTLELATDPGALRGVEGLLTTPLRELPVRW
ncbi:cytochrome P450 [Streptantibioticus cattleyicolor]|uniref:Cytochrome P450-like enzyme n=1 Tax=Streptantibioticus cattleyicolor (strain ATCC 35852 / DSM 46488 / JCM 4925 / NBRC 14057 / NRRL 8057) TaxID=1003195 RepID=F8JMW2_STREN|nr:cytochrome P450 [Streptantibioticus cattleyicolor]AEW99241.1 cytochrome P450-like enzyme [Streptantibioticus cattleyicolor NRRL 8057 = DSM 46488]CCB71716.1 Cytochrome P450 [Streptantibioticus cattleyicolor NRRL 8057 = DSM 46488]